MDDGSTHLETDDSIELELVIYADSLEAAGAFSAHVLDTLGGFGAIEVAGDPRRFAGEALGMFQVSFRIRMTAPAAARPKLLEHLADRWETKVDFEWVSEQEAIETPVSKWVEESSKKRRKRFAYPGVFAAEVSGPTTTHRAGAGRGMGSVDDGLGRAWSLGRVGWRRRRQGPTARASGLAPNHRRREFP